MVWTQGCLAEGSCSCCCWRCTPLTADTGAYDYVHGMLLAWHVRGGALCAALCATGWCHLLIGRSLIRDCWRMD